MNNYADETFAYVMKIKAAATSSDFYESGMRENYLLEEPGEAYNKYRTGTEWVEMMPSEINTLPIGAMFIGVGRRDSMSRNYVVIAKDQSGNAVWFPLDTSSSQVVQISEFNDATRKFEPKFRGELTNIELKLQTMCEPGKFYLSTDINGFNLPVFTYDENDDDELDDELSEEDQDILDRLKDEMEDLDDDDDDDDLDDDEEEHAHDVEVLSESVFLCVDVNGAKKFITVGEAIKLDDEIDDIKQHIEKLATHAKATLKGLHEEIDERSTINEAFNAVFPQFMKLSGMGKGIEDVDDEPIDMTIPTSSDEYDVKPVEEVKGDTDGDEIPTMGKYLPEDEDQIIIKPVEDKPAEPFGADDSKFEGPAEYDDSDVDTSKWKEVDDSATPEDIDTTAKQDFGDW